MRKYFSFVAFIFVISSCQQIDLQYSCDPSINQIVIENREEFSQINVQELTSYDPMLQKAIFESWDFNKKRDAWLNKLNIILSNNEFNEKEVEHINKLINHIEPKYFTNEFQEINSEIISQFADQWIKYGDAELNWTPEYIAFIVYRIYTDQSQFEDEMSLLEQLKGTMSIGTEVDCECSHEKDWCLYPSKCVQTSICNINSGCGWLFTYPCDGMCAY